MSIAALVAIFASQLAGETIVHLLAIPVPGPVLGFLLLFFALILRGSVPDTLNKTATGILAHLPLMFVPAVVGVVMHVERLANNWQAIAAGIGVSTILTLAIVALMMKALVRDVPHTPVDNRGLEDPSMSDTLPVTDIWAYLSATPLLGLTVTLAAYAASDWLYKKAGKPAALIPVLPAMIIVVCFLFVTGIDYPTYFEGAQFVHFMLGPATVALAIPLYNNLGMVKRASLAIMIIVPVGAIIAAISAVGIAYALGAPEELLLSIAPKSVTNPIAMGVTERLGGLPSLTAVMVICTGFFGVVIAGPLFKLCRVRCDRSKGMALGMAAHGIGTSQAVQISDEATAFAGLGMSLNGIATAVLVPLMFTLWR